MNQILLTDNEKMKKKLEKKIDSNPNNNYKEKTNNNFSGRNSSGDMKKIVIFFGIAIVVFAIAVIALFAFKSDDDKKEKKVEKPKLALEQVENDLKIIAEADAGISKITYIWNDEEPTELADVEGKEKFEQILEIPEGENKLKVTVIDNNGDEISTEQDFQIEIIGKPEIVIDQEIGNGKVKIIAKDETNFIEYITYKWNDEEEITVEAVNENQTSLEVTVDVKRGRNTLTVVAVNSLAKSETVEKIFEGVNKPIIEVVKDSEKLYMKITHDMGFKKILFTVNNQEYTYDENFSGYDPEQKEISYKFDLKEGENTVIIYATSTEGTEEFYRGKCNYEKTEE